MCSQTVLAEEEVWTECASSNWSKARRLSPEGRELWEELEFIRESVPDAADESGMAREYDIMERFFELPMPEQLVTSWWPGFAA